MIDAGFDLDNNGITDHVYSTDNYGSVILDANNILCFLWCNAIC